ncbi:MAG: exodeoxyribonuclease VII large subunit [Hydrogenophilales bacterium]|nr:exodeoxyribonuclease VII large subunit [Hydrogenophilales bacterium]
MLETTPDVISVTELNRLARFAVERALPIRWVIGEISNLTRAPSGHWYFTLKDANAAVRCAMFRNRNQFLDWRPENGMQVEVKAQATVYEARGEFQLSVEAMRRAGLGALFEAFAKLKEKLEHEGLFDAARKRPLPEFPRTIGIVTSAKAAALRDVLTTLRHRWPSAAVVVYPTLVQGKGAAEQIALALATAAARAECQVLLLVRGGGSIEDLWAFNEEPVARAIAASPIPVVSGVGHETDFTIADFVADLRAPTPTGAAQLATPDRAELAERFGHVVSRLGMAQRRRLDSLAQRLDSLTRNLRHPSAILEARHQHLEHLSRRLRINCLSRLDGQRLALKRASERLRYARPRPEEWRREVGELNQRLATALNHAQRRRADRLAALNANLAHLNPAAILGRGYSLVRDEAGDIVRDSAVLKTGDALEITLARGEVSARDRAALKKH